MQNAWNIQYEINKFINEITDSFWTRKLTYTLYICSRLFEIFSFAFLLNDAINSFETHKNIVHHHSYIHLVNTFIYELFSHVLTTAVSFIKYESLKWTESQIPFILIPVVYASPMFHLGYKLMSFIQLSWVGAEVVYMGIFCYSVTEKPFPNSPYPVCVRLMGNNGRC